MVPPDQARTIYLALKKKGLPVALVEFEGEQHGFRKVYAFCNSHFSSSKCLLHGDMEAELMHFTG